MRHLLPCPPCGRQGRPGQGFLAGSNTREPRGSAPRERDHRGGDHPVPSRTRQLSPPSPRVLQRKAAGGQGVALAEGAFRFARGAASPLRPRAWNSSGEARRGMLPPAGLFAFRGCSLRCGGLRLCGAKRPASPKGPRRIAWDVVGAPPAPVGPFDGGRPRIVALKARKGGVPSRDFLCLGDRPAGSGRHVRIALEGRGRIHSFAFSCSGAVRRRRAHASSFVEAGRVGRPRMACAARVER